jgi:hypothetical protein
LGQKSAPISRASRLTWRTNGGRWLVTKRYRISRVATFVKLGLGPASRSMVRRSRAGKAQIWRANISRQAREDGERGQRLSTAARHRIARKRSRHRGEYGPSCCSYNAAACDGQGARRSQVINRMCWSGRGVRIVKGTRSHGKAPPYAMHVMSILRILRLERINLGPFLSNPRPASLRHTPFPARTTAAPTLFNFHPSFALCQPSPYATLPRYDVTSHHRLAEAPFRRRCAGPWRHWPMALLAIKARIPGICIN